MFDIPKNIVNDKAFTFETNVVVMKAIRYEMIVWVIMGRRGYSQNAGVFDSPANINDKMVGAHHNL